MDPDLTLKLRAMVDLKDSEGYLLTMKDGISYWVLSEPIHWPEHIINQVVCVIRCQQPKGD